MRPRDPEDLRQRTATRADFHTEGVKGLFILHGGGSLALMTFITQAMGSSAIPFSLVRTACHSLLMLLVGLTCAAAINHLRYESSIRHDSSDTRGVGRRFGLAHRVLFLLSLGLFVSASGYLILAILRLYKPP